MSIVLWRVKFLTKLTVTPELWNTEVVTLNSNYISTNLVQ